MSEQHYSLGKTFFAHERFSVLDSQQTLPPRPVWIHRLTLYYTDNNKAIGQCEELIKGWAQWYYPSIPEIFDMWSKDNSICFVTRSVQGKKLSLLVTEHSEYPIWKLLHWGIQMTKALRYIHGKEFYHGKLEVDCFNVEYDEWCILTEPGWGLRLNSVVEESNYGLSPGGEKEYQTHQLRDIADWGAILGMLLTGERNFGYRSMSGHRTKEFDLDQARVYLNKRTLPDNLNNIILSAIQSAVPGQSGFQSFDDICQQLQQIKVE